MPVIVIATTKGGSGKTTTAFSVAACMRQSGLSVECVDTDINRNLYDQLTASPLVVPCTYADEESILETISAAAQRAQYILVDVGGTLSRGMIYALSRADGVIIPARPDRKDVVEAARTRELVTNAETMTGRTIPYAVLLSQVQARTQVSDKSRELLSGLGLTKLGTELPMRTVYQRTSYGGSPLDDGAARADVRRLTREILELVGAGGHAASVDPYRLERV